MSRVEKVLLGALASVLCVVSYVPAISVEYGDLHGARRKNPDSGFWEVGWNPRPLTKRLEMLRKGELQGVIFKEFTGDMGRNPVIAMSDLDVEAQRGIELPLLGIKSDLYIVTCRNVRCPIRYYADDGNIALEWWTGGYYRRGYAYPGSVKEKLAWLSKLDPDRRR